MNAPIPTFFGLPEPVRFEGPASANPIAYQYYDKDRIVAGRRMEDHLRFAVCYWHSFGWPGGDPFGGLLLLCHRSGLLALSFRLPGRPGGCLAVNGRERC